MKVTLENLWTIDGLVAVGTILLAGATFALAKVTVGMDRQAKRQVDVAREAMEMSRRPLIVGVPPGLSENRGEVAVEYADGDSVILPERGAIDMTKRPDGAVRLSVPFRNAGNGVALVTGVWARTREDVMRISGGITVAPLAPGEVGRLRLLPYGNPPIEGAMERGEVVIFGIQYTDAEGQQPMQSEIEVMAEPRTGNRVAGLTRLFRDGEEFAQTAW